MAPSSIAHQSNEDHTHSSMMAWRVHEFGPPDVMRFERILKPHPSPGEVLVKVKAAGVGPWDGWIRAGKSALPQPLPLTLGSDLSGDVVAVRSGTCVWEIRFMVAHRECRWRLGFRESEKERSRPIGIN
jgi:NADPH:quinone reductase-like Zn-dependent oxidoreductase